MNVLNRASTSIFRQLKKSIILLMLTAILGVVLLTSIVMSRALLITEEALLMQVPAVATLVYKSYGQETLWIQPTRGEIEAIGNLSYVQSYDFIMRSFFYSPNLIWPFLDNAEAWGDRGRSFMGRGVNNPEIADISSDLIYLVEGRTFTKEEISNSAPVVILPRDMANASDLSVGSIIEIKNIVYNIFSEGEDDVILAERTLNVEIIGLIGRNVDDIIGDPDYIYMPIGLAEDMLKFDTNIKLDFNAEKFRTIGQGAFQEDPILESIFVLESPRNLENFSIAADELLPENWSVVGIDDSVYSTIINSMNGILEISSMIQWGGIFATFLIMFLMLHLVLRDRRHEIGIYLSLGSKKKSIIFQLLTEVGMITLTGMVMAVLISSMMASSISSHLLEQRLFGQIETNYSDFSEIPWELTLFTPREMTAEEMLELYNVNLDLRIIFIFVVTGLFVILASSILPIWCLAKSKPKELLLQGKIG